MTFLVIFTNDMDGGLEMRAYGGCRLLPTEATGSIRWRLVPYSGLTTANMMMILL